MAIPLGRPLPDASCDLPGRPAAEARPGRLAAPAVPIRSCSRRGLPCRRRCRRRGALLPHPFTLARGPRLGNRGARAVCFLWRCLRGRPHRALPGAAPPWSPDFPLRASGAAIRPSGCRHCGARRRAASRGPAARVHAPRRVSGKSHTPKIISAASAADAHATSAAPAACSCRHMNAPSAATSADSNSLIGMGMTRSVAAPAARVKPSGRAPLPPACAPPARARAARRRTPQPAGR